MSFLELLKKVFTRPLGSRFGIFGIVFLAIPAFLGFFGHLWWPFDALANFRLQIAIGLIPYVVVFAVRRNYLMLGCYVIFLTMNSSSILIRVMGETPHDFVRDESTKRLVVYNMNAGNFETDVISREINRLNPDFVILIETHFGNRFKTYDYDWQQHRLEVLDLTMYGIAMYSRFPFQGVVKRDRETPPYIVSEIKLPSGENLKLVAAHAIVPLSANGFERRSRQMDLFASETSSDAAPTILAGDFNLTPWSNIFGEFISSSGLSDAMQGFGVGNTWPSYLPWIFRIPIDHIFVNSGVSVMNIQVGPSLGSDHQLLYMDLKINRE